MLPLPFSMSFFSARKKENAIDRENFAWTRTIAAVFGLLFITGIADVDRDRIRRRLAPLEVHAKADVVVVRGELPEDALTVFVRRHAHLTNRSRKNNRKGEEVHALTVTVSPLPTLITASFSFRICSLNSLTSFLVHMFAGVTGGRSLASSPGTASSPSAPALAAASPLPSSVSCAALGSLGTGC